MTPALILALLIDCQGLEIPIYTGQSWCWERPEIEDPNDPNEIEEK